MPHIRDNFGTGFPVANLIFSGGRFNQCLKNNELKKICFGKTTVHARVFAKMIKCGCIRAAFYP